MRSVLRRERRRRNLLARQNNPPPLPQNALLEHRDLPEPGVSESELRVVVTGDRFLAEGIVQSPAPLCYYLIYYDPDEAFSALQERATVGAIIDLDGWDVPTIALLDKVRTFRQRRPELKIAFLTSDDECALLSFVQASCRAVVISKRQRLCAMRGMLQSALIPPVPQGRVFTRKQWKILLLLAEGYSLRAIALEQQLPYHRITYRTGRILALLRLHCRQQLLRLLQRMSG